MRHWTCSLCLLPHAPCLASHNCFLWFTVVGHCHPPKVFTAEITLSVFQPDSPPSFHYPVFDREAQVKVPLIINPGRTRSKVFFSWQRARIEGRHTVLTWRNRADNCRVFQKISHIQATLGFCGVHSNVKSMWHPNTPFKGHDEKMKSNCVWLAAAKHFVHRRRKWKSNPRGQTLLTWVVYSVFIGYSDGWVRQTMCFPFTIQEIGHDKLWPELQINSSLVCIVHFLGWRICSITHGCHSWLSITGTPQRGPHCQDPKWGPSIW